MKIKTKGLIEKLDSELRRKKRSIYKCGSILLRIKRRKNGRFTKWINNHPTIKYYKANQYMRVASLFSRAETKVIPDDLLIIMAESGFPADLREKAKSLALDGESLPEYEIRGWKKSKMILADKKCQNHNFIQFKIEKNTPKIIEKILKNLRRTLSQADWSTVSDEEVESTLTELRFEMVKNITKN